MIASLQAFPARAKSGETFTYTFAITNTGNVDLHTVITSTLPEQVTPGGALTWTPVITAPGGVWVETVRVTTALDFSGTITSGLQITSQEGAGGVLTLRTVIEGQEDRSIYLPLVVNVDS